MTAAMSRRMPSAISGCRGSRPSPAARRISARWPSPTIGRSSSAIPRSGSGPTIIPTWSARCCETCASGGSAGKSATTPSSLSPFLRGEGGLRAQASEPGEGLLRRRPLTRLACRCHSMLASLSPPKRGEGGENQNRCTARVTRPSRSRGLSGWWSCPRHPFSRRHPSRACRKSSAHSRREIRCRRNPSSARLR